MFNWKEFRLETHTRGESPTICGIHEYGGFVPCPTCVPPASKIPISKVEVISDSSKKPWWLPSFVFFWMVSIITKTQTVVHKD